ncbi:MAG TPA: lytic transglycosylase domain-containing protein [Jatrophihabitans sp.]|jgi:membrane-bound lytic murein transglycosylase B
MPADPYHPRHAAPVGARRPLPGPAGAPLEDDVRAPGIAAMFRRHPERTRRAGVAGAGIAVMVLVASSVATAATETHRVGLVHLGNNASPQSSDRGLAARGTKGGQNRATGAVAASLVTTKHTAPATKAVISGLAGNGIPNVALNAYRVAADRMAHAMPSCGVDWALLAGIGREESDHGRFGGAHLNPDGTSTPRIIGPALDGVGTEYIPAPANGATLDGDATYTHALGPMQFIPQTWAGYGIDANGDGEADIFNINDAALAAARYLCANGGNLRTPAGQVRAILAYNHSNEYLAQVLALSDAYRAGVPVSGIPVGNIHGGLPPIGNVGSYPVNPGPPTAVSNGPASASGTQSGGTDGTPAGSHPGDGSGAQPGSGSRSGTGSSAPPPAASKSSAPTGSKPSGSTGSKSGGSSHQPAPAPGGGSSPGGGKLPVPLPTKLPTKLPTLLPSPTAPAASPKPTPTCVLGLNGTCIVP